MVGVSVNCYLESSGPTLKHSEIVGMGVAELRAELKKRDVKIPPKALKADMVKLLREAVKAGISVFPQ